jgi:hypothetical protein
VTIKITALEFPHICQCFEQLVFLFQYSIQNPWSFAHQAKEEENKTELKAYFTVVCTTIKFLLLFSATLMTLSFVCKQNFSDIFISGFSAE